MHPVELKKLIKSDLKKAIVKANNAGDYQRVRILKKKRWELRHKLYRYNMARQSP